MDDSKFPFYCCLLSIVNKLRFVKHLTEKKKKPLTASYQTYICLYKSIYKILMCLQEPRLDYL